jgi:regulator of protease activity HflC (stomatin/prohibitin superfamily)
MEMGKVEEPEGVKTVRSGLKWVGIIVLFFIGLMVLNSTMVTIGAGHRGVLTQFGKPIGVFDEGLSFKIPIIQGVIVMSVQTLKYEAQAGAASKDMQDVSTAVALNYHLDGSKVTDLYRTIGTNDIIESTILQPAIQESVKASTAQYNAEQLITERPIVKLTIEESLRNRLSEKGIIVETLSLTDFKFSPEFTQAIEQKQVAQQNAQKAENDLLRISVEARQQVAQAQGIANATLTKATAEAQAIEIQGKALRENQQVVTLRTVEKWDGHLPTVFSGDGQTMPFIFDMSKVQ